MEWMSDVPTEIQQQVSSEVDSSTPATSLLSDYHTAHSKHG